MTRDVSHGDIFTAPFDERNGRLLETPRRLTTDERGSYPGAWTPDGQTILFNLGQSGSQDIFKQRLDSESAEPLVEGPGNQVLPRITSDGQWVLFLEPIGTERRRIMRVPLAGGRPQQVLATGMAWPRCATRGPCVLFEQNADQWFISSLDPVRGRGMRLCSIPFNLRGEDLSPDGNAIALVVEDPRLDEPHSNLFDARRTAERSGGERRHLFVESGLGRQRSWLLLNEPNPQRE